jgi:hypothetical protein
MPTIESSMAQMYVSQPSSASRPAGAASSSGASTARGSVGSAPQPYAATHKDPTTGIETRWEVSGSSQYTDPNDASQRSLNLKRIRETGTQRDARTSPGKFASCETATHLMASPASHSEYRNGRVSISIHVPVKPLIHHGQVIEVLLVPPPLTSTDAVSRITPNEELPDRGLTRRRRFVIIRDNLDGGNSFEAM